MIDARKISNLEGGLSAFYTLDGYDKFGSSVVALGDVNGDGITDLAVGACEDDDWAGAVYVLFMNVTVIGAQKISNDYGGLSAFYTLDSGDGFGRSLAALGDWDGDGIPDMAVGAYLDDDGGYHAGAVYIIFLNSDGTAKAMTKISNSHGNLASFYTLDSGDAFGSSIAAIGDLNSDGVADLAVGAGLAEDSGYNAGALYILFMTASITVGGAQKISNSEGGFAAHYTLAEWDRFGSSVASIGDLDSDGISELVVGAHRDEQESAPVATLADSRIFETVERTAGCSIRRRRPHLP